MRTHWRLVLWASAIVVAIILDPILSDLIGKPSMETKVVIAVGFIALLIGQTEWSLAKRLNRVEDKLDALLGKR
jgi:hypothetical protein